MDEFYSSPNDKFVDIHGREIPTILAGKNNELTFSLVDLKQTGVGIYQKSQYAKLSQVDSKDFDTDFVEYMLECAKSYMLNNRISFSQGKILSSIQNCKSELTDTKKPTPQQDFFKNRSIASTSDDDILIQVTTAPTTKSPVTNKRKLPIPRTSLSRSPRQLESQNIASDIHVANGPQRQFRKFDQDIESQRPKDTTKTVENSRQVPVEKQNHSVKTPENNPKDKRFSVGKASEGPKLRPPKSRFSYNTNREEHDVIVSKIDKRNCVWVRDVANNELFDSIHEKVNKEAEFQQVPLKPWKMDKVYMANDDGVWFRCKIIRYNPLTVFFLDYGNAAEVDEIRDISEELAEIPCMAVRITFKESEYDPRLEDKIRIKRFMQNDDGTLFVNVFKTGSTEPPHSPKPLEASGYSSKFIQKRENSESNYSPKPSEASGYSSKFAPRRENPPTPEGTTFFKKPPFFCHPENDQKVVIVREENGIFYLRTRECFEKLREVERDIEEVVKTAKNVHNVAVNQLVLYKNNGKFYRGQVSKVNTINVKVECLDYVESATVSLTALKAISEELSKAPMTCFPGGKLAGFEDKEFDDNCRAFIEKDIKSRKKYRVTLGFDDELDLFDGTQLLSEQLQKLPKSPPRILLKHFKTFKPDFGLNRYLCAFYDSSTKFSLVLSDKLMQNIDKLVKADIEDDTPYTPVLHEVCVCYYVDQWYRCGICRILDGEYEVVLLDFGGVEVVKKELIRRPYEGITDVPPLGLPCKLTGLPECDDVEDVLKRIIVEGEIYNVNFKSVEDQKYCVEIPSVYQEIRDQL